MKHFLFRLIPPRPTFHLDMTDQEKAAMGLHLQYWSEQFHAGNVVVFGPVFDPNGVFGLGIIEVASEEEALDMAQNDPSVTSGVNTFELNPMMAGMVRKA